MHDADRYSIPLLGDGAGSGAGAFSIFSSRTD
jgi:hypothetical protein